MSLSFSFTSSLQHKGSMAACSDPSDPVQVVRFVCSSYLEMSPQYHSASCRDMLLLKVLEAAGADDFRGLGGKAGREADGGCRFKSEAPLNRQNICDDFSSSAGGLVAEKNSQKTSQELNAAQLLT